MRWIGIVITPTKMVEVSVNPEKGHILQCYIHVPLLIIMSPTIKVFSSTIVTAMIQWIKYWSYNSVFMESNESNKK